MLITYPDSLGGTLRELESVLEQYFRPAAAGGPVGAVHLLPFYPSSGDRGFAPIRYDEVEPAFGTWDDVRRLAAQYDLMADFMINHISRRSPYFADFLSRKDSSPYGGMFIRYKDFWKNGGPSDAQVDMIYKRKPRAPYVDVTFADGSVEKIWSTFDPEQIDLDLRSDVTRRFVRESLVALAERGVKIVRLDAFAYTVKKPDTSCFFVEPEVWELLDWTRSLLSPLETEILPEVHEHYSLQQKLSGHGYWVYDFALPLLVLHTLYTGSNERLLAWLRVCPRRQFTTLDTHDGIGVVDARGLLSDEEIDQVRENLFTRGANVKQVYSTAAYNNLDIYQINCTYYSALGADDDAYILARAIQFFAPGVPQVYYVGLLAGENDIELVESTRVGRNINRHPYTSAEIADAVRRPVVRRLINLMSFRNTCPAFEGRFEIVPTDSTETMRVAWRSAEAFAELSANLQDYTFQIRYRLESAGPVRMLEEV